MQRSENGGLRSETKAFDGNYGFCGVFSMGNVSLVGDTRRYPEIPGERVETLKSAGGMILWWEILGDGGIEWDRRKLDLT